jgi:hypothetical protein
MLSINFAISNASVAGNGLGYYVLLGSVSTLAPGPTKRSAQLLVGFYAGYDRYSGSNLSINCIKVVGWLDNKPKT